jgi:hypothetical protein
MLLLWLSLFDLLGCLSPDAFVQFDAGESRMSLTATEVFVPGAYPQHTYVERAAQGLESTLRNAINTPGQVVSLSGPSKSGKTVLVERVVGRDFLIPISGASIRDPDEIWERALDWMDVPTSMSSSRRVGGTVGGTIGVKGGVGIPLVARGEATAQAQSEVSADSSDEAVRERHGLAQIVKEIANSEFVVLLDDFHYMPREVQIEVAKVLKEAIRLGVKIVTAAVSHRGDDVVRANPELRGRVRTIDLGYWTEPELQKIADVGFAALNVAVDPASTKRFTQESAGSPQLMQSLCLQACFVLRIEGKSDTLFPIPVDINPDTQRWIFQQTSASTDFRSLVDVLDAGPRTRGTERKTYRFLDSTEGDVYRVVLRALADDPPRLSFPYEELLARTAKVCVTAPPVGSSVSGTCVHMAKLAQEKFPTDRAVDWDEQKQVFDVPDPYLLFYLRWSGRLREQ